MSDLVEIRVASHAPLRAPRPTWLRARAPGGPNHHELKVLTNKLELHTVCESAQCPNLGECWDQRTATFMILGDVCTRRCGFCAVPKGQPLTVDEAEPERVAQAVRALNLEYAVVTSVNRDDRKDGGAEIFARTIQAIRRLQPTCKIEVLIPDFQGSREALEIVMAAHPEVLNHNTETVPRLYKDVRPGAKYQQSLDLLLHASTVDGSVSTKSGIMVGLGESSDEILQTMQDLARHRVQILTIGQYLQPSRDHLPIMKYYHPSEFAEFREAGLRMGFAHIESGPLVRSSYHARAQLSAVSNR
ncbi:MAG TPA: lipoyl synthase [Pyrinomonadaceae bacterium]|nr:lipoyl synthase [Pyrinomonadaceae bacterium]